MDRFLAASRCQPVDASPHPPHNERGFTVIEAIIATMVLTVGLVALAGMLAVTLQMHQLGRNSAQATRLAQDKFEQLMKVNFQTNAAVQVNAANTLDSNVANYFDQVPGYTRRWQVSAG